MWRSGRMRTGPEPVVDILPREDERWQDGVRLSRGVSRGMWLLERAPVWAGGLSIATGATVLAGFFPAVTEDAAPLPTRTVMRRDVKGSETILLVEDSSQVRLVAREALVRSGNVVLEAANAAEALQVAEARCGRIRLLLTDVVMPGMSGRELADTLVVVRPDMRVLLASGYTDEALRHHGMNDRGYPMLQKPFHADVLTRTVREVLDATDGRAGQRTPSSSPASNT